ncbi:DUF5618 family protein [Dyadobacter sp. Leaf189]|uniref:DUF5618 family protein n=1 Tax=Dyadobacter sp. Leaf189 TaxID=1736295 RepID=UPI0006F3AD81|nr:DUF5618 family protein [Dyadobacter sp. Leaf189]KQS31393.1 hypothetical protein ASG33_13840 [Dyadobacter sp. Leaf189]
MKENTSDSIEEARRYLANAKQILSEKARKEDGYFQDQKYVKMAGHTAYTGILLVLDEIFGKKTRGRKDVDWYKQHLSQADKKMLNSFMTAYQVLHLDMAYDGAKSAALARLGLEEAEKLIHWVERKTGSA